MQFPSINDSIVQCLLQTFPLGSSVRWARRKKAPSIGPDASIIDITWESSYKYDGGFQVVVQWQKYGQTIENVIGTYRDYCNYMFKRYKQQIEFGPPPLRCHATKDIEFKNKDGEWIIAADAIPSFVRSRAQKQPITDEWIASHLKKSPMLKPPSPTMFKYTFGSKTDQRSNLQKINDILSRTSLPPPSPPTMSPLKPLPPPSFSIPPELSLAEDFEHLPPLPTIATPTPTDVLVSPLNFDFEDDWSTLEWDITPEDENEMIYPDFLQSLN